MAPLDPKLRFSQNYGIPAAPNNQQIEQLRQESLAAVPKMPVAMTNKGSSPALLSRLSPQAQAIAQSQALRAHQNQEYYNQQLAAAAAAKQRFQAAGAAQQAQMQAQALRNRVPNPGQGFYSYAKPVMGGN